MRLSDDTLLFVLQGLPRGYLDRIPDSNSVICCGIKRLSEPDNTSTGPRRRVTVDVYEPIGTLIDVLLSTCDPDNQEPTLADFSASRLRCRCPTELQRAIRDCVVSNIAFVYADAAVFNNFRDLAPRWRNGTVYGHPLQFESPAHLTQFFELLAVTTGTLYIDLLRQRHFNLYEEQFWALGAVNECAWLRIDNLPLDVFTSGAQILAWLKAAREPSAKRRLDIQASILDPTVEQVVHEIKSDFETSVERCSFTLKITWGPSSDPWFIVDEGRTPNADTGEELEISSDPGRTPTPQTGDFSTPVTWFSTMNSSIAREALRHFDRGSLEGIQIHSRYMRDLVACNVRSLPLRRIDKICILSGDVYISLTGDDCDAWLPSTDQNLETLFHRANNAFVDRLMVNFRPENRPFLHYMRADEANLRCRALYVCLLPMAESIDYAMADYLGRRLRPLVYRLETDMEDREDRSEHVLLFTRDAIRESVSHLEYKLYALPPPSCVITVLLRSSSVNTCTVSTYADPRPWIAEFVEAFGTVAPDESTVGEVTILSLRFRVNGYGVRPPLHNVLSPFERSPGNEVPTPNCAYIKEWCRGAPPERVVTESSIATCYVFENAVAKKNLSLFAWSIMHSDSEHYAFHLQIGPPGSRFIPLCAVLTVVPGLTTSFRGIFPKILPRLPVDENGDWKPSVTVKHLLIAIQDLLDNPNLLDPAQAPAYQVCSQNKAEYEKRVRRWAHQCSAAVVMRQMEGDGDN